MGKLEGYKTYITALLIGITSAVYTLGWIDSQAYAAILGLLGAGAAAAIHHAVIRSKK